MIAVQKTLFSKEECSLIIGLTKSNLKDWRLSDRAYHSRTIQYGDSTKWVFEKLKLFFELETGLQIIKLKNEIHFHKFIERDCFKIHSDDIDNRLYAVGVLLNSDFSGGDFKLYANKGMTLNKEVGNSYIFDVKIKHEITEILEGERYSLLWFLQKEHIKFKTISLL
jgi:hypothetical protein